MPERLKFKMGNSSELDNVKHEVGSILITTDTGNIYLDIDDGKETRLDLIDNKVKNAVNSIVNGATESFDTLKEIADWIDTHGADAEALVKSVQEEAVTRQEQDGLLAAAIALESENRLKELSDNVMLNNKTANIENNIKTKNIVNSIKGY